MSILIKITPDTTVPGSEDLAKDIKVELDALEVGNVDETTEKAKEGTLSLDITTIGVIINAARLSIEVIKAIISIVKEVQRRLADKKNISVENVPPVTLEVDIQKDKPLKLKIPSSKGTVTRFINKLNASKKNDEKGK